MPSPTVRSLREHGGLVTTSYNEQLPEEAILTFVDSPDMYARYLDLALEKYVAEIMVGVPL